MINVCPYTFCLGCECPKGRCVFDEELCNHCKNHDKEMNPKVYHNCECGGYKLGYTDRGIGHSFWCPMYKKL